MAILQIQEPQELQQIMEKDEPFTCLLYQDCPCDAATFQQQTRCAGIALLAKRSFARRRRKHIIELALSRDFGCPVRLFTDEDRARQWLAKQLKSC